MKLLIDMNLSPRWAQFLGEEGFEAVHWSVVGLPTAADSELMAYAAREDCVVLTQDLDFGSILAVTGGEKPSVVQIRSGNLQPNQIGSLIVEALRRLEVEISAGALVTIDAERTRVSFLPLDRG
jgi:predicted nuclease of predicted toxin-antitoxin system